MEMTHMQRAIPRELRRNVAFFFFFEIERNFKWKAGTIESWRRNCWGKEGPCRTDT